MARMQSIFSSKDIPKMREFADIAVPKQQPQKSCRLRSNPSPPVRIDESQTFGARLWSAVTPIG